MTLVLDAGAFVALERNDRAMWRRLKASAVAGEVPVTHGGVIAQVWRGGGGRQALLSRALPAVEIVGFDDRLGRIAGVLVARSGVIDAIDAGVVALSHDGDRIVTSDPDDLALLAAAAEFRVDVVPV
jgi:hypothetical protein